MDLKDCEELLDGFSTKLKDFDTKEYIITPEWLMEMINANKDYLLQELSEGNQANSEPANCAIFDVSKALIAFFKWREGQQLTADTVNEIETFAKEYQSNL